jgi:hypothetical protein
LAIAMLAVPALAQKADRPEVKVGDRWKFVVTIYRAKSDLAWEVTTVTPERIDGTENGKPLALTADLNEMESPRAKYSDYRLLNFPLEVGKKWNYTNDYAVYGAHGSGVGRAKTNVVVVGYEKVRVPAGEFDAFKLEAKGDWRSPQSVGPDMYGDISDKYWYAPAAHAIVKREHRSAYNPEITTELAEFQLRP